MARDKILSLTHLWIGYAVLTGLLGALMNGFDLLGLVVTAVVTIVSIGLSVVIGRALLGGSSLVWYLVVGLSGLGVLFGIGGFFSGFGLFFDTWSLSAIWGVILAIGSVFMNGISLKVLTNSSVRRHIRTH